MIKSDIIKIKKINNFDDIYIENELDKRGINPVRWAIVEVLDNDICISVSYIN